MITKFTNYILESKESIDYLETLTPNELGELLNAEIQKYSPDVQYIQNLLDVGCPVDFVRDGTTPLYYAALGKHHDVLKVLLSSGANINHKNNGGMAPLHFAVYHGHRELAELSLSMGADIDARDNDDWTPLHYASKYGYDWIVQSLLSGGADIHARNDDGDTPWDLAYGVVRDKFPELNPNA